MDGANERQAQKAYWEEHSSKPTVEAMMLDSMAADIDALERPEVLSTLGDIEGCRVLELGAGIGRFTGDLARKAGSVVAVDFMATSIAENKRVNGHHRNVRFEVSDVTELDVQHRAYDIVFSNWLLMYLSDTEVENLGRRMLDWVGEGGTIFFRESCFRQSGDKARKSNPTHYRHPQDYFRIFDALEEEAGDGRHAYFELVSCKCIDTYARIKRNQSQICWKWRKVVSRTPRGAQLRHFLDGQQYTMPHILRYERAFGQGFVSTGGADTTARLLPLLRLPASGGRLLDVGCGIGGGDFMIADAFLGAHVHGMDLSVNMVMLALQRAADRPQPPGSQGTVTFEVADVLTRDFGHATFDVAYSRDAFLHIHDKPALFGRLLSWLKPGGQLLFTDYSRAASQPSPEFAEYIKSRGYDLRPVQDYGRLLEDCGFVDVKAEDWTDTFSACLRTELERFEAERAAFLQDFTAEDYEAIVQGWNDKLRRVQAGEQRWGMFSATKPAASGSPEGQVV